MRPLAIAVLLLLVAFAQPGAGDEPPGAADLLRSIDVVPQRVDLDQAMGPSSLQQLIAIATNAPPPTSDTGIRLRAVRALAQYPSDEAHGAVVQVLADPGITDVRHAFVLRRAALESLGEIGTPDDVSVITDYLMDSQPKDIRAAAARALGALGSTLAVPDLQKRLGQETDPQVLVAIIEALRELLGES